MLEIYTDGSCSGNGKSNNSGGCGFVAVKDGVVVEVFNSRSKNTTNNREEFNAISSAIQYAKDEEVMIYTDSAYCLNTITKWMYSWAGNGWIKSDKKAPENLDIVIPIYTYMQFRTNVKFTKVAGHSGNVYNEIADALATANRSKFEKFISQVKVTEQRSFGTDLTF